MGLYLIAFVLYFSILIMIGFLSHHKQKSNADFIVGNRSLNFWLTALSAHASDMSAWLFMGLPMAVFLRGVSGSWIAIGLLCGMFATWKLVAAKLRVATEKYEAYTLSTYFENRFGDTSGILRLVTAFMLLFFLTHYLAAGLTAMGLLLESVFGMNYFLGLSFAVCVLVCYTFSGGFVTIAWTDVFQALFLLGVIITVPILTFFSMNDGMGAIENLVHADPHYLELMPQGGGNSLFSAFSLALAWGLGYFGMPHIITKFMGLRDAKEMTKAMCVGMTWQFLALTASVAVGITGASFFQGVEINPELVFVEAVKMLFHPLFAGFVLCGVLAANLSTMDSQLLVCASVIGEDLYEKIFESKRNEVHAVRASRIGLITIAGIALLIAFKRSETIMDTVLYAWAGLGSTFGPLVLLSLYSKKVNRYGAIVGVIVGGIFAIAWPTLNGFLLEEKIPAMVPGFFMSFLMIYAVSLLTKERVPTNN